MTNKDPAARAPPGVVRGVFGVSLCGAGRPEEGVSDRPLVPLVCYNASHSTLEGDTVGVAAEHWDCNVQHPARQGHRKGREHSVGCAVSAGHDADRQPFRCRVCARKYRPPQTNRRLSGISMHFSCTLERAEHQPSVPLYSKSGHRDDCPTNDPHRGKQGSSCPACRSTYLGKRELIPTGKWNDHEHWDCAIPAVDHKSVYAYGQGHRPGCGVTDGHTPGSSVRSCTACRRVYQQTAVKTARLKKVYRLSREDYDAMLAAQEGACAICGNPPTDDGPRTGVSLHVDHDHRTGRIRALLCRKCNVGLGSFMDDPDLLVKASEYLRGHTEA